MLNHRFFRTPSEFGDLLIVWKNTEERIQIERILLPFNGKSREGELYRLYGNLREDLPGELNNLKQKLKCALRGESTDFNLERLNWSRCTSFQQRVMKEEYKIKAGQVISYSELAQRIGGKQYTRAVGNVQARNPFPIIIPCHRVIRADGSPGYYGGGVIMKQKLLILERRKNPGVTSLHNLSF